MPRRWILVTAAAIAATVSGLLSAQGLGGGQEWSTQQADAQRTSWLRTDSYISAAAMQSGMFGLQWTIKLENAPRQNESLIPAATMANIGVFVPVSIVTGTSNNAFGFDTDVGHVMWTRHFEAPLPATSSAACPGGITSAPTRATTIVPPSGPSGRALMARSGQPYTNGVGQPGEGAPVPAAGRAGATAAPVASRGAGAAPNGPGRVNAPGGSPPQGTGPGRGAAPARGGGAGAGIPSPSTFVIASDGVLHRLGPSLGKDVHQPLSFLPPNARVGDTIAIDATVYATTINNCGGVPNGVWALDTSAANPVPSSWKTDGGSPLGLAFAADGTLFAAVGASAQSASSSAVVALDPKTLSVRDTFTSSEPIASGPMVMTSHGREMLVVATRDARLIGLDPKSLGGADARRALTISAALAAPTGEPPRLTHWRDQIAAAPGVPAAPTAGWVAVAVDAAAGARSGGSGTVAALRVSEASGQIASERVWSASMNSPSQPIVVNGVLFVASRGSRTSPARLFAYDAASGKALWNSGTSISSAMSSRGIWSANGQVYVATIDGTVYAFGLPAERWNGRAPAEMR